MKTRTIYRSIYIALPVSLLITSVMAATFTDHAIQLRYGNPAGQAKLSINQDISAGTHKSVARRRISMDFEFGEAPGAVNIGIIKINGSYTAHDMTRRLPTSGLAGQSFTLRKTRDNRALQRAEPDEGLQIGLEPMVGTNYPIGLALADVLPILPEQPVTVGSSWESARDLCSLEGWAWTQGQLNSQHTVTGVMHRDGHTIVDVTTKASARLNDVEGGIALKGEGELNRSAQWQFDATDGSLLSMSMEQVTTGTSNLPQGDLDVRQRTVVRFSTR